MTQHTRWHNAVESFDVERLDPSNSEYPHIRRMMESSSVLDILTSDIPVFRLPVVHEVKEFMKDRSKYLSEFVTLSDALRDQMNSPFDNFIIENEVATGDGSVDVTFTHYRKVSHQCYAVTVFYMVDDFLMTTVVNAPVVLRNDETENALNHDYGEYIEIPEFDFSSGRSWQQTMTLGIAADFAKLTVLLNTRGVEQTVFNAPRFTNTQRKKKGKPPIPTVIHVYFSHYYDKSGERHELSDSKPVAMHWRRGHTRGVWCGSGENRRLEQRYISPCLVNYDGGDKPQHKARILH